MIYKIYIVLFILSIALYNIEIIHKKLKEFLPLVEKAKNNPSIIRDISLGFFINGVFSILNATSVYGVVGYGVLTLWAIVGIINANERLKG